VLNRSALVTFALTADRYLFEDSPRIETPNFFAARGVFSPDSRLFALIRG